MGETEKETGRERERERNRSKRWILKYIDRSRIK